MGSRINRHQGFPGSGENGVSGRMPGGVFFAWISFKLGYKVGPLLVINGVITPISRVITPVTHL